MKKRFLALCLLAIFVLVPTMGQAAKYPSKPITIVVSYSAGGAHDTMARILVPHMEQLLGTKVIVKNSSGASGTIGAAEGANAKPDGYTLYLLAGGPAITQPALRKLPYSSDSFQLISLLYNTPHMIMAAKGGKYKNLDDFIKAAKENPGQILCASTGVGSTPHLNIIAFQKAYGIELKHMPERSGAEAMKNLAGGTLDAVLDNEAYVPRFDTLGLLRFWPTRSTDKAMDYIPSTKEFGKEVYFSAWTGMVAPKGTPADVIKKLDETFAQIMKLPKVQEQAIQNGLYAEYLNTADFQKLYNNEIPKIQGLIKEAGLLPK
ncbi:tripartite tricarboxylate transporter substrate binding protein [Desulfovibrio sp. OttesenSCG-928-O18]|nr:tripartite tricarboxylate transporter substrate binding protein [Desulfovibrio sp. OttesenSCG-928-O18]